ncbi:MAG: Polysaccharide lyase, partial [Segetibacter sp.]|nr:Polysaccharide lyase [Segetibacter sp.]
KNGLNPKSSADATVDRNNDGYTNIEEYLNSLVDIQNVIPAAARQTALNK